MIKYQLICKDCELTFDSWFASSLEFEKLKRNKYLNCHKCDSINIDKSLMKPNVMNNRKDFTNSDLLDKKIDIRKTIKDYQNFIKRNFDYVGENFTYEARRIYYEKKKRKKGIFGRATKKDVLELKEEGIETQSIPWIEDKNN